MINNSSLSSSSSSNLPSSLWQENSLSKEETLRLRKAHLGYE